MIYEIEYLHHKGADLEVEYVNAENSEAAQTLFKSQNPETVVTAVTEYEENDIYED